MKMQLRLLECGHIMNVDINKGQDIAKEWWSMIMEFTGGDMSMIPELEKFNENKKDWSNEWKEKQAIANEFIGKALRVYSCDKFIFKIPQPLH
jgi:hypothetical protein